jgi:hypothetical protein
MYTSPFDECNLFNENQASQYSTESIAHQLRHNLGEAMRQTYRPEISNIEGVRLLWNQDHRGLVEIRLCAAQGRWYYYDYFAHFCHVTTNMIRYQNTNLEYRIDIYFF